MSKPKPPARANVFHLPPPPEPISIPTIDEWVSSKGEQRRLTIDMPANLHLKFKTICAAHKTSMVEVITQAVEDYVLRAGSRNGEPAEDR